ncbi:MAG: shikimate kinase [Spirochaetia bacterium]|jgi:shikimate kinase|nr:shikimate kinase [Candidatus Cloacimonadota bacterium]MDX9828521.1 shikimate kinase [Spirochaetia bacterium]
MNLYIIGFSRAGKSTFAKQLANTWMIPVVDTDVLIEQTSGHSIAEIVQDKGWAEFRRLESQALISTGTAMSPFSSDGALSPVATRPQGISKVVSCGGGIVESADNRCFLQRHKLLWLNPPWDLIWQRICQQPSAITRGKSEEELKSLYNQRYPLYQELMYNAGIDTQTIC